MSNPAHSTGLRVVVHSGTQQIGASCIEVASARTRIILDCGWPLDGSAESIPPSVPGLFAPGSPPDALLLSHAHPDHTGFIEAMPAGIPIYATVETSKIMLVGSCYARGVQLPRDRFTPVTIPRDSGACSPFHIGDLTITAYPVDHSAYGAVAYLVEGCGKKVFYTGDLRFHGRKRGMSKRIERELTGKIDLLITEGTNVGRRQSGLDSENAVEAKATEVMRQCSSLAMASFSPQNIDRFVSYFRAAQKTGRIFVCDHYMAAVLYVVNRRSFPTTALDGSLRVFFSRERRCIEKFERHSRAAAITLEEIQAEPSRYVMLVRPRMIRQDFGGRVPEGSVLLYGMWSGYRGKDEWKDVESTLRACGSRIHECHASGHAHEPDLMEFINAIRPTNVLPVHTLHASFFAHFAFRTVQELDGIPIPV
jgi:ribonuclease J